MNKRALLLIISAFIIKFAVSCTCEDPILQSVERTSLNFEYQESVTLEGNIQEIFFLFETNTVNIQPLTSTFSFQNTYAKSPCDSDEFRFLDTISNIQLLSHDIDENIELDITSNFEVISIEDTIVLNEYNEKDFMDSYGNVSSVTHAPFRSLAIKDKDNSYTPPENFYLSTIVTFHSGKVITATTDTLVRKNSY